jgi:hypothetical protein
MVAQYVIGRARQLVGDGFDCYHRVGLGRLPLIETPNLRVTAYRKIRRFHECPRQIFVAVLGVAPPLGFAVAQPLAADTTAVGRVVAYLGEPSDVPGFQQDGRRKDVADPQQVREPGRVVFVVINETLSRYQWDIHKTRPPSSRQL